MLLLFGLKYGVEYFMCCFLANKSSSNLLSLNCTLKNVLPVVDCFAVVLYYWNVFLICDDKKYFRIICKRWVMAACIEPNQFPWLTYLSTRDTNSKRSWTVVQAPVHANCGLIRNTRGPEPSERVWWIHWENNVGRGYHRRNFVWWSWKHGALFLLLHIFLSVDKVFAVQKYFEARICPAD